MSKSPSLRIGIIGLGIMGSAMARALLAAGHEVFGCDIDKTRTRALRRAGGGVAAHVTELAECCHALITSLPSAKALHEVVQQLQDAQAPRRGQILLETSTLPLSDKAQADVQLRGQRRVMLDAPISGTATPQPAQTWIMYLSGPAAACRKVQPWLSHFTLKSPYVGPIGNGTKLKLAANHQVAIYNVACAEMVALCRQMGLDPALALQHMGSSPYIGTGLMRIRMPMMLGRRYQPATMKIGIWQKDMQIIGNLARELNCPTPMLNASADIYTAAMAMGLADHDTAATAEVLAVLSGKRPAKRQASG